MRQKVKYNYFPKTKHETKKISSLGEKYLRNQDYLKKAKISLLINEKKKGKNILIKGFLK